MSIITLTVSLPLPVLANGPSNDWSISNESLSGNVYSFAICSSSDSGTDQGHLNFTNSVEFSCVVSATKGGNLVQVESRDPSIGSVGDSISYKLDIGQDKNSCSNYAVTLSSNGRYSLQQGTFSIKGGQCDTNDLYIALSIRTFYFSNLMIIKTLLD